MSGSLCHRFGPGRLPYADRRGLGGGIAMAATGALAAVLWFALLTAFRAVAGPRNATLGLVHGLGVSSPLAVAGAFAAGTLLWRYWLSDGPDPVRGALAGGVTALLSLLPVAVGFGLLVAVTNVTALTVAELATATVDFAAVGAMTYLVAALLVGWLALPLGLFGGWYHERARLENPDRTDTVDRAA